jgi:hypothetical protein
MCMHGYSVEYPKFLTKRFIYIVYYMYMYQKIEKNTTKQAFQSQYCELGFVATTPIRPKTPQPTRHSFLSLSSSAAVQPAQDATPLIRPRPAGAEPPTAGLKGGQRDTGDTPSATLLPSGAA